MSPDPPPDTKYDLLIGFDSGGGTQTVTAQHLQLTTMVAYGSALTGTDTRVQTTGALGSRKISNAMSRPPTATAMSRPPTATATDQFFIGNTTCSLASTQEGKPRISQRNTSNSPLWWHTAPL